MTENVVRIMCPNLMCRNILAVPNSARGRIVRCKGCATNIRIPSADAAAKSKPAAAPPPAEDEPKRKSA